MNEDLIEGRMLIYDDFRFTVYVPFNFITCFYHEGISFDFDIDINEKRLKHEIPYYFSGYGEYSTRNSCGNSHFETQKMFVKNSDIKSIIDLLFIGNETDAKFLIQNISEQICDEYFGCY